MTELPDPEGEGGDFYHHFVLELAPGAESASLTPCGANHCDCPNRKRCRINPETRDGSVKI